MILNKIWSGYTRFNDIRRAVGNISPGVLSKRLSELEKAGLVERVEDRARGTVDYIRTQMAIDLEPVMDALSVWAQRNMMWFFGKAVQTAHFPARRVVIRLHFSEEIGPYPTWWLLADPGAPCEICVQIPDVDVDLYVETTKVSWNAFFLGRSTIAREVDAGRLFITGDAVLMRTMEKWLPRSAYADAKDIRMLPGID